MGDDGRVARVATARLTLLQGEIGQPHARPPGPSGRTRSPFPAGPIPAGMLDHLRDAYQEAVSHTREVAPEAGPAPADSRQIYRWMDQVTRHLDADKRQVTEELMYRQGLEHALRRGDTDVVRPETCPACECYSLFWDQARQRAVCAVSDCTTNGRPSAWTLRELATQAVEKSPTRAAT